jgi:integrase/recombinase XerC
MATAEQVVAWNEVRGRGVEGELYVALGLWSEESLSASTLERLAGLFTRFANRLIATGVESLLEVRLADCEGFIWAPTKRNSAPSLHTIHLRRTAVRGLFRTLRQLELDFVDPTAHLDLPSKGDPRARPLTDDELTSLRIAALGRVRSSNRAALAVALAESTATTGEISQVRWRDVDLAAGTVALPGASPIRARTVTLSPWGRGVLTRVSDETSPPADDFVVSRRGYTDSHSGQAAMANLLAKLLDAAGLVGGDVRPTSIRLWAGATVLDTRGVEAAAAALGITSLDATLRSLHQQRGAS